MVIPNFGWSERLRELLRCVCVVCCASSCFHKATCSSYCRADATRRLCCFVGLDACVAAKRFVDPTPFEIRFCGSKQVDGPRLSRCSRHVRAFVSPFSRCCCFFKVLAVAQFELTTFPSHHHPKFSYLYYELLNATPLKMVLFSSHTVLPSRYLSRLKKQNVNFSDTGNDLFGCSGVNCLSRVEWKECTCASCI